MSIIRDPLLFFDFPKSTIISGFTCNFLNFIKKSSLYFCSLILKLVETKGILSPVIILIKKSLFGKRIANELFFPQISFGNLSFAFKIKVVGFFLYK